MNNHSSALLTDKYELTMVDAAFASGAAHRKSVFEVFARRLPEGRRYGVVAGTGRALEAIRDFRFTPEQIDYLSSSTSLGEQTLEWLANYQFTGEAYGYAEGEIYFPNSPIFSVEASFAEACLLETVVLSIFNHDSAIASAGSRMSTAARGRPLIEMGSRRTHEQAAVAAARAAIIAGFSSTSNLEAGLRYGVPVVGTAAHSFTLLHDSEREAFQAQVDAFGPQTSLLVDTYDVMRGVRTAVEVAGPELGAVRLDSGDLVAQAYQVRSLLDELGNRNTKIVVTSDLDEYSIAGLAAAPVDSYGVGTSLVTGSGAPTAGMVYKLVSRENDDGDQIAVAKASKDKVSVGGRKFAGRALNERSIATAELVGIGAPNFEHLEAPQVSSVRELIQPLMREGKILEGLTGNHGVLQAAQRHADSLAELPGAAAKLQRGEPVIPTEFLR